MARFVLKYWIWERSMPFDKYYVIPLMAFVSVFESPAIRNPSHAES